MPGKEGKFLLLSSALGVGHHAKPSEIYFTVGMNARPSFRLLPQPPSQLRRYFARTICFYRFEAENDGEDGGVKRLNKQT